AQPLTAEQRKQLQDLGVQLLEHVPENTYICGYRGDLQAIRALPFVQWVNPYMRGFKIAPALHQAAGGVAKAQFRDMLGPSAAPDAGTKLVDIVLHRNADEAAAAKAIAQAGGLDAEKLAPSHGKLRVSVPSDRLAAIAALDAVRHIEPVY